METRPIFGIKASNGFWRTRSCCQFLAKPNRHANTCGTASQKIVQNGSENNSDITANQSLPLRLQAYRNISAGMLTEWKLEVRILCPALYLQERQEEEPLTANAEAKQKKTEYTSHTLYQSSQFDLFGGGRERSVTSRRPNCKPTCHSAERAVMRGDGGLRQRAHSKRSPVCGESWGVIETFQPVLSVPVTISTLHNVS